MTKQQFVWKKTQKIISCNSRVLFGGKNSQKVKMAAGKTIFKEDGILLFFNLFQQKWCNKNVTPLFFAPLPPSHSCPFIGQFTCTITPNDTQQQKSACPFKNNKEQTQTEIWQQFKESGHNPKTWSWNFPYILIFNRILIQKYFNIFLKFICTNFTVPHIVHNSCPLFPIFMQSSTFTKYYRTTVDLSICF